MLSGATLGVEVCNGLEDVIEKLEVFSKFITIPILGKYGLMDACD